MMNRRTFVFYFFFTLALGQEVPEFDEKRAFGYLEAQCDFGPRVPGTVGHRKGLRHIIDTVSSLADTVLLQSFSHSDAYTGKLYKLTNVLARFRPSEKQRFWIAAHWDTRPWADQDRNPKNRSKPVLGANDGASGVAVLMELAHQLSKTPPPVGIDLVFIDGEDMGKSGDLVRFFNGSRHLARNIPPPAPEYCILIDMVGDSDLQLPVEGNSKNQAPDLVEQLWGEAEELGLGQFSRETAYSVEDDHVVLYEVGGIPSIDIIDFDYGLGKDNYWHTVEDTPDKCSPESLDVVGTLLLHHIYGRK
ncbi:MAG: M28 family peptidase [Candidatus Neomarinimicrobiota bacterium]|nr:M28 family peptidase [Candidatus Neomarinimicrobiota bacterium]